METAIRYARPYHVDGTVPTGRGVVFVFGSNLAGRHGKGAAKVAAEMFGARHGEAVGRLGMAYAIPTKNATFRPLPLNAVEFYIDGFVEYARSNMTTRFFVTRIGRGLAGNADADIAPLFRAAPCNCDLPEAWREWIGG